jgi:hypothetical protein
MLTYAQAETVLARMHLADAEAQTGPFRSRIKNLRKLGIPLGLSPGKGKKLLYSMEYIYQWALCLELSQFGVDPTVIAEFVKYNWDGLLKEAFEQAGPVGSSNQTFLYFSPWIMTSGWKSDVGGAFPRIGDIGVSSRDELLQRLSSDSSDPRLSVVDLSKIVASIQQGATAVQSGWA